MSEATNEAIKKFRRTPKLYFYLGGLAGLLAFIAISAWWDLTFGEFVVKDFIADTLILTAIALATMVLTDLLSKEVNKNRVQGVHNRARNAYDAIHMEVEAILIYFSQWYFWYWEIENKHKREGYLVLSGFDGISARKIVAFAELSDIEPMKTVSGYVKVLADGREIPMPKIETLEQEKAVESVLKGQQDVKTRDYVVYLYIDDISEANMSTLERQEYLERRRKQSKRKAYIMRIIMLVFTCLLMAALVPADDGEENAVKKWWQFIKRFGVFVTSFISGWLAGSTDVAAEAAKINDKASKLRTFKAHYDSHEWKPKTQEELDQEAIAEWHKNNPQSNINEPQLAKGATV